MITAMPRIAIAVHDFDAACATFRETLGMPVSDFSGSTVPGLGAHVGMCMPAGGSNIELMAPADPDAPLSRSLRRFLDARGEGPFALMLEAPDPDAEALELAARGLDVLPLMPGAGGRDVHPRSTHGVLVRVYPDGSVANAPDRPAGIHGLSGITTVVIATADVDAARAPWGHGFGLVTEPPVDDATRGLRSVVCRPPAGGVIELVAAVDPQRPFARDIARFVAEEHEGMYALTLAAPDPDAVLDHLDSAGVVTASAPAPHAVICGTRFLVAPA